MAIKCDTCQPKSQMHCEEDWLKMPFPEQTAPFSTPSKSVGHISAATGICGRQSELPACTSHQVGNYFLHCCCPLFLDARRACEAADGVCMPLQMFSMYAILKRPANYGLAPAAYNMPIGSLDLSIRPSCTGCLVKMLTLAVVFPTMLQHSTLRAWVAQPDGQPGQGWLQGPHLPVFQKYCGQVGDLQALVGGPAEIPHTVRPFCQHSRLHRPSLRCLRGLQGGQTCMHHELRIFLMWGACGD